MAIEAAERLDDLRTALANFAEAERLFSRAYAAAFGDESVGLPLAANLNRAGVLAGHDKVTITLDALVGHCVARATASIALVAPSLRVRRAATFAGRRQRA
jgi:hypothetical protein